MPDRRSLRSNSKPEDNTDKDNNNNNDNKRTTRSRTNTKKDDSAASTPKRVTRSASKKVAKEEGDQDVEMGGVKDNVKDDKDEEMTLVVPPTKGGSNDGENAGKEGEDAKEEPEIDPEEKALQDIKTGIPLLERAVKEFDARLTLRVLRSISSIRKHLSADVLARLIVDTYSRGNETAQLFLAHIGKQNAFDIVAGAMELDDNSKSADDKKTLPEVDFFIAILIQVFLHDTKDITGGANFSDKVVQLLRSVNRRTVDVLAARIYFYYAIFYEQMSPLPPSPAAAVISIRQNLLAALRSAVLRRDYEVQATVTNLLLRNYLLTTHINQADLFIAHSEFPEQASNNQVARYLYYLGRIRAIQLRYTEAHEHLIGATRKSPSSPVAGGFYQAAHKLLVLVELLMGDIPDRALFRQPMLEGAASMQPYQQLVQAVSIGDLDRFQRIVALHGNSTFQRDGTYSLILRLRQNVIKTGIRMMSLSYTRISLRDICIRLGLESEESAEYIVAKAIRDGVIEATLDHENGFMKSKDVGDVYATAEPGEVFHERITACLRLHDECVQAMRYPQNQHRLELKNAQEAREKERELATEIAEGNLDDDDADGDFDL
ncbi:26S proteasome non-ATPase regulatory subunit [Ascosphaera pollenicola]|nr:26S proteasome non-ATPase regulatory subunit [Ascosphaera pollenicola]